MTEPIIYIIMMLGWVLAVLQIYVYAHVWHFEHERAEKNWNTAVKYWAAWAYKMDPEDVDVEFVRKQLNDIADGMDRVKKQLDEMGIHSGDDNP